MRGEEVKEEGFGGKEEGFGGKDDGDDDWEELIRGLGGFGSVEGGFDRMTDQRLYLEMRRQVGAIRND